MKLQEFIKACHAAQHDAGNSTYFGKKVEKALEVCGDERLDDPVAAFLAALIVNNNGNIDDAREGFDFWMSELKRVFDAVKEK